MKYSSSIQYPYRPLSATCSARSASATDVTRAAPLRLSDVEVVGTVPLVGEVPHREGAVELDASRREPAGVGEVARSDVAHLERLDSPSGGPELDPVETSAPSRDGIAEGAGLEEPRGRLEAREARGLRQVTSESAAHV